MRWKSWRALLVCAAICLLPVSAYVRLSAVGVQPFPALVESFAIGTSATAPLPTDFRVDRPVTVRTVGSYSFATAATTAAAGNGMSTFAVSGIYNFGAGVSSTSTERAVGFLSSGTTGIPSGNLYLKLTNTSGTALSGLQIAYDVEKYRNGSNTAGFRFQLFYSTDGVNWTSAGNDFLTAFGADGNNNGFAAAPGVTVPVSKSLNVPIATDQDFYLAWNYSVTSGTTISNAQALAIDNVSITGLAAPSPDLRAWMGATPASVGAGSSVTVDVLVVPATGANPSTGVTVTADLSAIGGGTAEPLIDIGGNRFTLAGLVQAATTAGAKTIVATARDAQNRSATATTIVTVVNPTPISVTASVSPSGVAPGSATTITATVTPGAFPASTGMSVAGDLTAIGGSASQTFVAGTNNRFTFTATVATDTIPGEKSLKVTASDAEGRTANATAVLTVIGPAPRGVVISQIYGAGGDSGALFNADYLELYNTTGADFSLAGWSIQYANATGATWSSTPLTGVIKAGGYYLVRESSGANGAPLPAPDATGTIGFNASTGKIALVNATTALGIGSSCPLQVLTVADFVGYGSSANCFEGTAPTGTISPTEAALRVGGGAIDTDDNGADFEVGSPFPRGSVGIPPAGTGLATPQTVPTGAPTTLTVKVTPGAFPTSTSISVTADLTPIGGPAAALFVDDGSNTFSYTQTVNAAPAVRTITATITDAQLRTSFTSIRVGVDEAITPIHDIQGPGTRSDLLPPGALSEYVTTTGIVTALTSNGVFLQVPDQDVDSDPGTSEGIFVFTSTAPPNFLHIGDAAVVSGSLQEFVPASDPTSPPVTEIATAAFRVISSGNDLPLPVQLLPSFTTATGGFEQLERFEGMRVKGDIEVVAPTQGSIDEKNATSTSTGLFDAVIKGVARPMREAGLEPTQTLPAGTTARHVPQFDGNPERLRVDSDAQIGASKLEVVAGQTFTDLTGVLDYSFRSYMILPDPTDPGGHPWVAAGNAAVIPVPVAGPNEFTVAHFNLERFFDTVDEAGKSDVTLTGAALDGRLKKASDAIRHVLRAPDVLGVGDVENLGVLQDLASRISADATADHEPDPQYEAHLLEGHDAGGLDVGFLVKRAGNRVNPRLLTQIGGDELFTFGFDTSFLNDRPSLVLEADVLSPDGRAYPVTAIVSHLLSLSGIDGPDGDRIRNKRRAQAEFLANYIQTRQLANPGEWIVSVGDYNAFQFNDGYVDVMGTITGAPTPPDQVVLASSDLVNPNLTNLVTKLPIDQQYSFTFDGNAQALDHVLVNDAMLKRYSRLAFARVDADFPEAFRGDFNRPERVSDHDAPVAFFAFPGAPSLALNGAAEMTVEYNTAFVDPGVTASDPDYPVTITRTGSVDTLTLGNYRLTYTASNGFVSTSVTRLVHVVDTIAPAITLIGANPDTVEAGKSYVDPGATATDERLGDLTSAITVTGTVLTTSGTYTLTYSVSDGFNTRTATRTVKVIDTTAPVISDLTITPGSFGPPNHKMFDVTVSYSVLEFTREPTCTLHVSSNEPINGLGDGNTSFDWQVVDSHHVRLRAERSGLGHGRIYTIAIRCTDAAGNSSTTEYGTVSVSK